MRASSGFQLAQKHDDGLQNIERLEAGDDDRLVFVLRDPFVGAAADHGGNVSRPDEGVDAHVGRIENRANGRNDGDVIAEDRKILDAFRFRAHQRERGRGRGGLESDGEEHHVLVGILLRQLESIGRRVNDAHIHAASFVFKRAAVRAGHAHHVTEGGEDHVGILRDGKAVVDSSHRQNADRAAGAVNQLNVRREARSFRPKR